jgi:hypothetical protein
MSNEPIPPSKSSLADALCLSEEILKDIELNQIPLAIIALKTSRLARLLNEFDFQQIMQYESGGYPNTPTGIPPDVWKLLVLAGRRYYEIDKKTGTKKEFGHIISITEIEQEIKIGESHLLASRDADISISSANPNQFVIGPQGNVRERNNVRSNIQKNTSLLSSRRLFIYEYASTKFYELKFSSISDDVFSRIRYRVDDQIGRLIPSSTKKFTAIYENLKSENSEDWSNAVHGCRRILEELADVLTPPTNDKIIKIGNGQKKTIKMGKENYTCPSA